MSEYQNTEDTTDFADRIRLLDRSARAYAALDAYGVRCAELAGIENCMGVVGALKGTRDRPAYPGGLWARDETI